MSDRISSRQPPPRGGSVHGVILLVVIGAIVGIVLMYLNVETSEQRLDREADERLKDVETRFSEVMEAIVNGKFRTPDDYEDFNNSFASTRNGFEQQGNLEGWKLSPLMVEMLKNCSNTDREIDIRGVNSDRPIINIIFSEPCLSPFTYPADKGFYFELQRVSGKLYVYRANLSRFSVNGG